MNRTNFDGAGFAIYFVAQFEAIRPVYGNTSRDFCLIESGLMVSQLESTAITNQIGLCHIGGLSFEPLRHWFDLDEGHAYLYSLVGGLIEPVQTGLAALVEESEELQIALELLKERPGSNGHDGARKMTTPASERLNGGDGQRFANELREFLSRKLPQYMVPSAFVTLEKLPLSANGKVDRNSLPRPEAAEIVATATPEYLAPETETERLIATVWRDVLGADKVGVHDNFFDIGGIL